MQEMTAFADRPVFLRDNPANRDFSGFIFLQYPRHDPVFYGASLPVGGKCGRRTYPHNPDLELKIH